MSTVLRRAFFVLCCLLLVLGCSKTKHGPRALVSPPPSGRALRTYEADDLDGRRYWERFEMAPADLPSWEATLFCRLDAPRDTRLVRRRKGEPEWTDMSSVRLHRGCAGILKTLDGHLTDEASVLVDVGTPGTMTVWIEVNE